MIVKSYCDKEVVGKFSANSILATSDDRLKFNEKDIENGLDVISQLQPKIYDKSKTLNVEENTHKEAGLIAQEVLQTDLSFCVSGGDYKDGLNENVEMAYQVNYNDVIAYLIASVKELKLKIESLES